MNKIYLNKQDDRIVIDDPDPRMASFLKSINPRFKVVSAPCPGSFIPKYRIARNTWVSGIDREELYEMSLEEVFAAIMASRSDILAVGEVSLLDLIQHCVFKLFEECCLCANECGVNRFKEPGRCGLGHVARVCSVFTHIYEELPCNPAAIINCAGCGMDCVYCIDHEHLIPAKHPALDVKALQANILKLTGSGAIALEFGTGCVESLPWVITILNSLPENFNLPVVFNCHLYVPVDVVAVLSNIVDVYLPDLRYFNNSCARWLSGVENYIETATAALEAMVRSDARVIVRILVLPGHVECCHEPALRFLAQFRERIWISVLGQYVPVRDAHKYQDINRRPTLDEVKAVEDLVVKYGLRDVNKNPESFWE